MFQNDSDGFIEDQPDLNVGPGPKSCNVIRPANASYAEQWESIPETLVLNSVIGLILFFTFVWLTWIAWQRADSPDQLETQSLVTFLYGYRDPEKWYVIPRFEFLRREERHHKHDINYPYVYVPPKLPLINPLELLAISEGETSTSTSDPEAGTDGGSTIFGGPGRRPRFKGLKSIDVPVKESTESAVSDFTSSSVADSSVMSTGASQANPATSSTAGVATRFYPSILTAEQVQASYLSRKLNKFFAVFFRVSDAELIYARGIDAYEYLLFQRHLILVMFVTTLLCLGVILPIHWLGAAGADPKMARTSSFQRTTIKNIALVPHYHWAHIVCSAIIVLTTYKAMASYRESIITQNDTQISRRTLLIGNIPTNQRTRIKLTRTIQEYFPRNNVEAVQFVYDSKSLVMDEMYLSSIIAAKEYCSAYKLKQNSEIQVHRTDVNQGRVCDGYCRLCSFFYVCCCYWPLEHKEPGTTYYAKEEERYRKRIADTCDRILTEPAEYAFVTFKSYKQARRVMAELANLKQDAIEGRPDRRQRSLSRAAKTVSVDFRRSSRRKKTIDTLDSEDSEKLKADKSKFIESSHDNPAVKDPLDPINNPHVRSIRAPSGEKAKEKQQLLQLKPLAGKSLDGVQTTGQQQSVLARKTSEPGQESALEGPLAWSVRYAPHPDNVEFDDLLNLARTSRWTIMLLQFLMIIIFIFVTTPNVILSMIERVYILQPSKAGELTDFQKLGLNYLSVLLQIVTTAVLPALVTLISKQIPYEDSSTKSHSVMWKAYLFLVLMVIVMPSIGMSSAQALFANDINPRCLFPTDNGAYYINYVVSSLCLSTMLELIKPIDIIFYCFILWTSRSSAEIESGRQFIDREFSVGMQHTGVLLVFSVVMTYSISCPLIAPVGLVYMCVKHAVDHYHLYYSYFTKKVDKDLQTTIVMFVKVALLLMLFQTTIAIWINTGTGHFAVLSQMLFWVVLATLGFNCFFDCGARNATNTAHKKPKYSHEFCACFYLPKVISSLIRRDAVPTKYISRKV